MPIDPVPLGCDVCDRCHAVSAPYANWPSCRACLDVCCPACAEPGTVNDEDGEQPRCWCPPCFLDAFPPSGYHGMHRGGDGGGR